MVKLSKRLFAAASMVTAGNSLADIGTDHGYIPIWLVENGKIPKALAMDIGAGPLERAKEHISREGLEDYIETRLSDGLGKLRPGEADTVLVAGMGGSLIIQILTNGEKNLEGVRELVLGPQSEVDKVRRFLVQSGYLIDREELISDAGKFYPILHVSIANEQGKLTPHEEQEIQQTQNMQNTVAEWKDYEYEFGRFPIREKNSELVLFLQKKKEQYEGIRKNLMSDNQGRAEKNISAEQRIYEIDRELELIRQAEYAMRK